MSKITINLDYESNKLIDLEASLRRNKTIFNKAMKWATNTMVKIEKTLETISKLKETEYEKQIINKDLKREEKNEKTKESHATHMQRDSAKINNNNNNKRANEIHKLCNPHHLIQTESTLQIIEKRNECEKLNRARKNAGLWLDVLQEQNNQGEDELRSEYIRNSMRVKELKINIYNKNKELKKKTLSIDNLSAKLKEQDDKLKETIDVISGMMGYIDRVGLGLNELIVMVNKEVESRGQNVEFLTWTVGEIIKRLPDKSIIGNEAIK